LHFNDDCSADEDDRKPSACSGMYRDIFCLIHSHSKGDEERSLVTEDSDEDRSYRTSRTHCSIKNMHFAESSSGSDNEDEDNITANKKLLEGTDNDHSQEMDDHRGNGKCLEATENSRPHGDRIKDRRRKKDRETENSNNESMGLRDDEMEGHRSILQRAISVGIFDRGSANPFIFKIRVGKSQHITPLLSIRN
jgi:hypothetical protein